MHLRRVRAGGSTPRRMVGGLAIATLVLAAFATIAASDDTDGKDGEACPGDSGSVLLTPEHAENPVGEDHTMTFTVLGAQDEPCPDVEVTFEVDDEGDPSTTREEAETDENGQAFFTFTNTEAVTNTILACTEDQVDDFDAPHDCGDEEPHLDAMATKTWTNGDDGDDNGDDDNGDDDGDDACPGDFGSLTLTPEHDENPVNTDHMMTATVLGAEDEPCEGVEVTFEVDDQGEPSPTRAEVTTDENGQAFFTFTNSRAVTNTILACSEDQVDDFDAPHDCGDEEPHLDASATKTWTGDGNGNGACPGDQGGITLTPEHDENPVNTDHTLTATLFGGQGEPCENVEVKFEVDDAGDPDPTEAVVVTDENGEAQFTFTNSEAVTNTILACAEDQTDDFDAPNDCGDEEPHLDASATKTWTNGNGACPGDDGSLTVDPEHAENPVNTDHTITATLRGAEGEPCEGVEVKFEVDDAGDPDPTEGIVVTDENGEAPFTFTNSEAVTNTILICAEDQTDDFDAPNDCGDEEPHLDKQATKTWTADGNGACPGDDGSLTLDPEDAENPVNTDHTLTATVLGGEGEPCPGVEVKFEVDDAGDPDPTEAVVVTDENGEAEFTFTNSEAVTNTIRACAEDQIDDFDAPNDCGDEEDHLDDSATKTWTDDPPVTPTCRANTLGIALGGNALPNAFEANPDSNPCMTEQAGLLVALQPLLEPAGLTNEDNQILLGEPEGPFLLLDVLWADTERDGSNGHADSGVLLLVLSDGTQSLEVEIATSRSDTNCDDESTTTEATLVAVRAGGEEVAIPGEHIVLITPELNDLIELHLEDAGDGADEGPDDTGAQAVDLSALMDNVLVSVADSETGCSTP